MASKGVPYGLGKDHVQYPRPQENQDDQKGAGRKYPCPALASDARRGRQMQSRWVLDGFRQASLYRRHLEHDNRHSLAHGPAWIDHFRRTGNDRQAGRSDLHPELAKVSE